MQTFYIIPFEYEQLLADAVAVWTSAPNNGWTIITGVYTDTADTPTNAVSEVRNVTWTREIQDIPLFLKERKLAYFILEGDLELFAPEFESQLLSLNGVLQFQTNLQVIDFKATL
jgi:hypothetical protein